MSAPKRPNSRQNLDIAPNIAPMLGELGLTAPRPAPLMPLHHQMAQKLHAASAPHLRAPLRLSAAAGVAAHHSRGRDLGGDVPDGEGGPRRAPDRRRGGCLGKPPRAED